MYSDEQLKNQITPLLAYTPDGTEVAEQLWYLEGYRDLSDAEQDEVLERVFELIDGAEVTVTWND